uniref:Uncharacterized protein n=1 Tax=Octopus bimaculoides TaxID=37653 RepID=A0A0L8IB21_OCTBM
MQIKIATHSKHHHPKCWYLIDLFIKIYRSMLTKSECHAGRNKVFFDKSWNKFVLSFSERFQCALVN